MAQRNNIIRLHSLIHNQISAPIYKPMIRYAWFKSGYLDNHPGQFQTVTDVCFKLSQPHCDILSCDSFSLIRCSYCRKTPCFNHFFIEYHMKSSTLTNNSACRPFPFFSFLHVIVETKNICIDNRFSEKSKIMGKLCFSTET